MKVGQTSCTEPLSVKEVAQLLYDRLASVDDEELHEVLHDFLVRANDSDQADASSRAPDASAARGQPIRTPPSDRGSVAETAEQTT